MLEIFDKLEKNVCRVFLNEKGNGTGFLISNKFILTDYHVIDETSSIKVKFDNDKEYKVTLYKIDSMYKDLDIALLELEKEVDFYENIEIEKSRKLKRGKRWVTRGYPASKSGRVENMWNDKHVVHEIFIRLDDEGFDIELNFDTSKWSSYRGLSGSPIVINGCIVGIITSQQINEKSTELYGLSVEYFKELIDEVREKEQKENEITETIKLENGKTFEIELVKVELEDKILYVGKYPVTFEEYDLFCQDIGKVNKPNDYNWGRKNRPLVDISWNNSIEYCKWISKNCNKNYRLLTSEEWIDIAKRDIPEKKIKKYIVHSKSKTEKVGSKKVGQLGLYDFIGNVYEWCENNFISGIPFSDIKLEYNDIFNAILIQPDTRKNNIGFRVVKYEYNLKIYDKI